MLITAEATGRGENKMLSFCSVLMAPSAIEPENLAVTIVTYHNSTIAERMKHSGW